jgi:hypothetical protein
MIKLQRIRTATAVSAGLRGDKRIDRTLLLLVGFRDNNLKFTSKNSYWKTAKPQLRREANGKCAYCESPAATVAHCDVEHFRPKARYWWLAYCYDNYLFSCQLCNESFKGDDFPIAGAAMVIQPPLPVPLAGTDAQLRLLAARLAPDPLDDAAGLPLAQFQAAAQGEQAALIDPYLTDPERYFGWVADAVLKEVQITARRNTADCTLAAAAAQQHLGLNREELRRARWKTYIKAKTFADALKTPNVAPDLRADFAARLKEMVFGDEAYTAMVRYFMAEEWKLVLP